MFDTTVKVSLKPGMLNPEATTIKTSNTISFVIEAESEDDARAKVDDMCQKLLCNPIIHNYTISLIKMDFTCGSCE